MITLTISESAANELRAALAATPPVSTEPATPQPIPLPAPPTPAPADGTVAGFDRILRYEWDWAHGSLVAYTYELGGIGQNGLVVIGFDVPSSTPVGAVGSISIAPYPGDISGATRTVSISQTSGDLSVVYPWSRVGVDTGMQFQIEGVSRFLPVLTRGWRYYINIATRDALGNNTAAEGGRACDMVIQASRPT